MRLLIIDKNNPLAYYKQIQEQLMLLIRLNVYPPHARLPSIREVAAGSHININTVKKAFAELETLGIIYTVSGKGCFVSEQAMESDILIQSSLQQLEQALYSAAAKGIPLARVTELTTQVYREQEQMKHNKTVESS